MNRLILLIFFLVSTMLSYSQRFMIQDTLNLSGLNQIREMTEPNSRLSDTTRLIFHCSRTFNESESPLYIINNYRAIHYNEFILNPSTLKSIYILKGDDAIKRYGSSAKYGVILLQVSDSVELLSLNELLNHFDICDQYRTLPIFVNDKVVSMPQNIIADLSYIKSICVTENKLGKYSSNTGISNNYISIITNE